jgi:hypothetical protein
LDSRTVRTRAIEVYASIRVDEMLVRAKMEIERFPKSFKGQAKGIGVSEHGGTVGYGTCMKQVRRAREDL